MGNLIIRQVRYSGDKFWYISPELKPGLNILEAPNGCGKSTFTNLIYYCFGGSVNEFDPSGKTRHAEICGDSNNSIELDVKINNEKFTLKRLINTNQIAVISDNDIQNYPINRSNATDRIFSDWILSKLGIEPVDLYQGNATFKINIKDLFRLIYHNQEIDPRKIYKSPDSENFITDSETLRKTIFQILIGKNFNEYYSLLSEFKKAEQKKNLDKSILDEFDKVVISLGDNKERVNLLHLRSKKDELEGQLDRLYIHRSSLKKKKNIPSNSLSNVDELKSELIGIEISLNELKSKEIDVLNEINRLHRLMDQIVTDVTQIKKIIFTHQSLNIFSPDTCPYCLNKIDRKEGKCVCGSEVDESEYEKFFYTSEEYLDILKSKQKSINTVSIAIESCNFEYNIIISDSKKIYERRSAIVATIKELIDSLDNNFDYSMVDNVDDKIVELKSEINIFEQRIELEQKLEKIQIDYNKSYDNFVTIKNELSVLEGKVNNEILQTVKDFSAIYNKMMQSAVSDCRVSKIDQYNYMPIINNGEYTEASASVPIRLLYYFTILSMSLADNNVKFPRFLLIDTPNTAGIDKDNLIKALSQLDTISEDMDETSNFQIILTTGLNMYKNEYKKYVFQELSKKSRLLNNVPT